MPKHDISSRHFQRKISEFCEVRIAPMPSRRVLENIRPYLISLNIYRKGPPILNGHLDWTAIVEACGIEADMTVELRKQLRPPLDAIIRWLKAPPVSENALSVKQATRASKAEKVEKESRSFRGQKTATRYGRRSFCSERVKVTRAYPETNQPIPESAV